MGQGAFRRTDNFNIQFSWKYFFPQYSELHFGKTIANTSMDTESKWKMSPWALPVNDELIRVCNHSLVTVAGQIPHNYFFSCGYLHACYFSLFGGRSPHHGEGRLPANNFWHHGRDQSRITLEHSPLLWMIMQSQQSACNWITCRVIAANNQQDQGAKKLLLIHFQRGMRQHRNQVALGFAVCAFLVEIIEIVKTGLQRLNPLLFSIDFSARY